MIIFIGFIYIARASAFGRLSYIQWIGARPSRFSAMSSFIRTEDGAEFQRLRLISSAARRPALP